jgi:hypothetical protein
MMKRSGLAPGLPVWWHSFALGQHSTIQQCKLPAIVVMPPLLSHGPIGIAVQQGDDWHPRWISSLRELSKRDERAEKKERQPVIMNNTTMNHEASWHTLVASTNAGRHALDAPDGIDLTTGSALAVQLSADWWVEGTVEHGGGKRYAIEQTHSVEKGYYLLTDGGYVLGLCAGMKVRQLA